MGGTHARTAVVARAAAPASLWAAVALTAALSRPLSVRTGARVAPRHALALALGAMRGLVSGRRACVSSSVATRDHHVGRLAAQARAAQAATKTARQPARHRASALHVDHQAPPLQLLCICCAEGCLHVAPRVELDEGITARLVRHGIVHDPQRLDRAVRLKLPPQL